MECFYKKSAIDCTPPVPLTHIFLIIHYACWFKMKTVISELRATFVNYIGVCVLVNFASLFSILFSPYVIFQGHFLYVKSIPNTQLYLI